MLVRNCAGGIVFHGDKVLILRNEKSEWVFPKGVIRADETLETVATVRVKVEAGVDAVIVGTAGMTNYEFYSVTRHRPVWNKITWFIMVADSDRCAPSKEQNFSAGGFYPIEEAAGLITYSQDKSLLMVSYHKYLSDRIPNQ